MNLRHFADQVIKIILPEFENASSGSSFHDDKQKGVDVGIGTEKLYETCSSWCVYFKTRISETAYET